jgi:nitrogen fixation protein NifU and related proteins
MFNNTVLDHFKNPRNAGELPDANSIVEVANPVCGDVLRLAVRWEEGRVSAVRFKTQGCVAAIASSSVLTELMAGRSVPEIRQITSQQISESLGGLPPATFHAAQLCSDGLAALLSKVS